MSLTVKPLTDANSPAQGTPFSGMDNGQFVEYGFFYVVPSNAGNGGYITGGDPMSFAGVTDLLKTGYAPLTAQCYSQNPNGAGHAGYQYFYRPGGAGYQATWPGPRPASLTTTHQPHASLILPTQRSSEELPPTFREAIYSIL